MARPSRKNASVNALSTVVQDVTRGGHEVIDYLLRTMRDETARTADRTDAARTLLDRGWGRSVERIEVAQTDEASERLADLADVALEALLEGLDRRPGRSMVDTLPIEDAIAYLPGQSDSQSVGGDRPLAVPAEIPPAPDTSARPDASPPGAQGADDGGGGGPGREPGRQPDCDQGRGPGGGLHPLSNAQGAPGGP